MSCCSPAHAEVFDEKVARRDLRRYRRKGLDRPGRRLAEMLREVGVTGRTVVEVGGGIGALQVDLLQTGAVHATNVELSPGYEQAASELVEDAGVAGKVERLFGDIVQEPSLAPEADAVVLNRVVCCYPDAEALMTAVAERARSAIALSFPPDIWPARLVVWATNLMLRIRGNEFRAFVHPQAAILAPALARGFRVHESGRAGVWRVVALVR
jgi:magnesium-protoporphyrin O-methyltransferase